MHQEADNAEQGSGVSGSLNFHLSTEGHRQVLYAVSLCASRHSDGDLPWQRHCAGVFARRRFCSRFPVCSVPETVRSAKPLRAAFASVRL